MKNAKVRRVNLSLLTAEIQNIITLTKECVILTDLNHLPFGNNPHRLDIGLISICLRGSIDVTINMIPYTFEANDMVMLLTDQIVQGDKQSDDFACCVFALSLQCIQTSIMQYPQFIPILLQIKNNPRIQLQPDEVTLILEYHALLCKKAKVQTNYFQQEIQSSLFHALLYEIGHIVHHHIPNEKRVKTRKDRLFEQFILAVRHYCKQERAVSFFAAKLCVTPKHLSNVLKIQTGKSAGEWIDDYVMMEARILLHSKDMSILQISEELNFANQSFFCKYFKQHAGITPTKYRQQQF